LCFENALKCRICYVLEFPDDSRCLLITIIFIICFLISEKMFQEKLLFQIIFHFIALGILMVRNANTSSLYIFLMSTTKIYWFFSVFFFRQQRNFSFFYFKKKGFFSLFFDIFHKVKVNFDANKTIYLDPFWVFFILFFDFFSMWISECDKDNMKDVLKSEIFFFFSLLHFDVSLRKEMFIFFSRRKDSRLDSREKMMIFMWKGKEKKYLNTINFINLNDNVVEIQFIFRCLYVC
jgi:hypothetical protein